MKQQTQRLLALDILRGITIAGMIMVNNPGSWGTIYAPLKHAAWNGLTPTDLVFPFFMFIMGVSMEFSLRKYQHGLDRQNLTKILKRTATIFLIGTAIAWMSSFCYPFFNIGNTSAGWMERFTANIFPFDRIRILGVMPRLALTYCAGAIISLLVSHKQQLYIAAGILISYFLILFFGHGFELSSDNIIAVVDRAVLGTNHMYHMTDPEGVRIAFDPEGLLSTLPCISHVLIGMYMGRVILNNKDQYHLVAQISIVGIILLFSGFLLSYGCPINKSIWSPTFVLTTCGLGSLFLALLIFILDIKHKVKWSRFFESFGINPLFMYVLGAVLSILMGSIKFRLDDKIFSIKGYIYQELLIPVLPEYMASLAFALLFVGLNWVIGYQLYRRKIYIKI